MNTKELEKKALEIRQLMVCTLLATQLGHPGGSFSCVDILTALYFKIMNINNKLPGWQERDRFILSKGHASLAYYSILAVRGYFEQDIMKTFRSNDSILSGHPDMNKVPGVDMSTGSLGQGLSVGAGMALSAKLDKRPSRTFVLIGDGESQEGQVWEAALSAAQYKLDNLVAIVDRNMLQLDGRTEEILKMEPLSAKWESFGWNVTECDGHSMEQLVRNLSACKTNNKPTVLIARTVKGKGIALMEDKCEWHGMKCKITGEDEKKILNDVELDNDNTIAP
jgi:transketolase